MLLIFHAQGEIQHRVPANEIRIYSQGETILHLALIRGLVVNVSLVNDYQVKQCVKDAILRKNCRILLNNT